MEIKYKDVEIKYKDVEKNIDKNIPIETDYFIADLNLDSDGINIYLLIKIDETVKNHYIKGFDLNNAVDYLNELYEEYDDLINNNFLFNIPNGFLAVIYEYYKENKNKKHKNKYIWNLIEETCTFIVKGKITKFNENDKESLLNWLNDMLDKNKKYDKIYHDYEGGESFY